MTEISSKGSVCSNNQTILQHFSRRFRLWPRDRRIIKSNRAIRAMIKGYNHACLIRIPPIRTRTLTRVAILSIRSGPRILGALLLLHMGRGHILLQAHAIKRALHDAAECRNKIPIAPRNIYYKTKTRGPKPLEDPTEDLLRSPGPS